MGLWVIDQIRPATGRVNPLDNVETARLAIAGGHFETLKLDGFDDSARTLWHRSVERVQNGDYDDRPLYWQRLASLQQRSSERDVSEYEAASRGLADLQFTRSDDRRFNVLVTGFDPFHLDTHITQSNPSGIAALALDGRKIECAGGTALIQSALVPVRYVDFDDGLIERMVAPVFDDQLIDMVLTISMGRDQFDLERFPGLRRSVEMPDNLNVYTGASDTNPLVPKGLIGPEFVEFSLPVEVMQSANGPFEVRDNRVVTTLEQGEFAAESLAQLEGLTAVRGGGGGYLSNEISYRVINCARKKNYDIRIGHIHTPRIAGYDAALTRQIVDQTICIVEAAVSSLG